MGEPTIEEAIVRCLTQKTVLFGYKELAEKIKAMDPPLSEEEVAEIEEAIRPWWWDDDG